MRSLVVDKTSQFHSLMALCFEDAGESVRRIDEMGVCCIHFIHNQCM